VIVAGKRCPVAGRISMDMLAIDITDLPNNAVRRGHMVTLIGEGKALPSTSCRTISAPSAMKC
jgi:alanine racemase